MIESSTPTALSDVKKALLEKLAKERGLRGAAVTGIQPRSPMQQMPLSHAQRSLWFIDQLDGNSSTYNMGGGLGIQGEFSLPTLRLALQDVLQRHELLRCVFAGTEHGPVLRQNAAAAFPLQVEELPAGTLTDDDAIDRLKAFAARPFDLEQGPLIRACVVVQGPSLHLLYFSMHHIVSDAWSMNILLQEVLQAYLARREGNPPAWTPLAVQYADYAHWQSAPEQQASLERQLAYWMRQLDGVPHTLELPTDYPRPAQLDLRGGSVPFELDAALSARVNALARNTGATPFMLLLASWQLLLWRTSQQEDFVVGVSTLNRPQRELEPLIGYFVNTLAVRSRMEPDMPFLAYLDAVRATLTDAYAHQDLPFERVVDGVGVSRGLDRAPLAQARFAFANVQDQQVQTPGLQFTPLVLDDTNANAKCDLLLVMWPDQGRFRGTMQYSAALYADSTAQRLVQRLQALLTSLCDAPQQRLRDMRHLPVAELAQIRAWQGQRLPQPDVGTLPAWVYAHAASRPGDPAVAAAGQVLDYAQTASAAACIADALRARNIGRGDRVGICTSRSPAFVVALLGVMSCGAAYVPLDGNAPATRLSAVSDEAQLCLVLVDRTTQERVATLAANTLLVETDAIHVSAPDQWRNDARLADPAYVIFTSGSTGRPKGVQVPHSALANYAHGIRGALAVPEGSEYLALSTLAADLGNTALLGALSSGGCVRMLDEDAALDPVRMAAELQQRPVDCLKIVPSHLDMLLRTGQGATLLPRQCLVFGGEALSASLVARVRALAPTLRIVNHYGPTETTIGVLTHTVAEDVETTVPLGRPLPNVAVRLLDANGQPVGIGEIGELHVGGACVADGYLNDPRGTAQRFLPFPDAEDPHRRSYRTGDLARWCEDGQVLFLGRRDHQVKIRGHRVELGEVEAVIRAIPGVSDCAVLTASGAPVDDALQAFVVALQLDAAHLRDTIRQQVPEYMVPTLVHLLDSLPLNPNGKIDRAELQRRGTILQQAPIEANDEGDEADDSAVRTTVRAVWAEVLKRSDFDDTTRFFDLGGHSLLATLVVFRLRKSLLASLSVRDLFEHATVHTLSRFIEDQQVHQTRAVGTAGPVAVSPRPASLPLTLTQERLWFVDQMASGSAAYNMPLGLRLKGPLDEVALTRALEHIAGRHEVLRTRFTSEGGRPIQVVEAKASVTVLRECAEGDIDADIERVRQREVATGFDLARGPLLRVCLLDLGPDDAALFLTLHHIISDGWSNEVIASELSECYAAYRNGAQPQLPPLHLQYADFALWERAQLDSGAFDPHIAHWKRRLAGAPTISPLPLDRPRDASMGTAGGTAQVMIPAEVATALKELAKSAGTTLFVVMQAAFKLLLSKYSGERDIVIGTTHANRGRPELEPLVGFFVNQIVLRSTFNPDETVTTMLQNESRSVAEDFSHHELPLNTLVASLALERRLDASPVFQTLFVLQNIPSSGLELPDLSVQRIDFAVQEAKFDLSLFVFETTEGMLAAFTYKSGLFDAGTIERMGSRFVTLLRNLTLSPDQAIGSIAMIPDSELDAVRQSEARQESDKLSKLRSVRRRSVSSAAEDMVTSTVLDTARGFPLCIQPTRDDLNLARWAADNRAWIEDRLRKYGALLFRGFGRGHATVDLETFAAAVSDRLIDEYGDLPRDSVSGRVYKSTPYPADKAILVHNESSHLHRYPTKIFFSCVIPARSGGESPLVDCRALHRHLDSAIIEKLRRKKLKYVRNYIDSVDVSWQHFFQTEDRNAVEAYCLRNGIAFEWFGESGLRTSVVCDAVRRHQTTAEEVFFNQICLHHISCVDPSTRDSLIRLYGMDGLPRNVYYGDGEPIEDEVVAAIQQAVAELSVAFPWEKHDVVMVDNVLCAHARNPFEGERKIVVAIADIHDDRVDA